MFIKSNSFMKIKITLTILIVLIFQKGISQPLEDQIGLKAGVNINTLGGKETGLYPSIGYHVGFAYEALVADGFTLQPELLFSLQGATINQAYNERLKYYYLLFPLIAKVYLAENFSFEAGPQVGYLVHALQRNDFGSGPPMLDPRKTDVSVVAGLSYRLPKSVAFSLRYTYGLSNTNKTAVILEQRENNRVFQASVLLLF